MKTVSLHTRLLLATLVPVSLFVILYGVLTVMFRFQDIDELQTRNAELLAEKYRLAVIAADNPVEWPGVLQQALENKYVRAVSVLDGTGRSIAHAGPRLRVPQQGRLATGLELRSSQTSDGEHYLQAITPLQHRGETYWLALELRPALFTIARYQSMIMTSVSAFILLFVLALVLTAAIRRWLEPVGRMSQQLSRINAENLHLRLDCKAQGDLAELQDDINGLLQRVSHSMDELHQDIEQTKADLDENYQTIEAQNIELRLSRAQAIEGNRIKSAFLANISHELRTPLNSINGFSRLLMKTPLQPRQSDFVETIQKSANNLLSIINDVLDFSKIEAGKLQLEKQPFALEDAVFDVLNMLSPQADDKGLEQIAFIYDDVPRVIEGDVLRFKQVLTNLVSNAIKFTAQGEVIVRVMVEESVSSRHHLRISVSDTGIGLSRTAKADLFQAFQQGDLSVSRQFGGTGLGLVIAKNLVALMEGQIGFDEAQEKGSTFWFDFKAGVVAEPEQPAVSLVHKQVLLLERHEASCKLMAGILSRAGADVMTPGNWSALNEALTQPCDALIISGHNLPKNAAEDELERIREHFGGLIIVLTRACDNNLDPAVFERLHISTLSKPIRPRQLTTLLAQGFSVARIRSPAQDTASLVAKSSGLRILAVDDHPANLKLVCTLLEDLGIEAVAASSGMEAVTRAAEENFDLIFMDIQMPGMSGIDATRAIRDQEREGRRVPIIALTAHALADEREMMLREGMNDYLTKPLQEEQLVRIIQRWTGVILHETPWSDHPDFPPATQPVDWRECLQLAAGKADLARDMLDMLLDSLAPLREKMEQAISQRNYAALLSHTHYLHGATRYCGVPQLRTATGNLESRLKALLKESTDAAYADLSGDIAVLMQAISELETWRRETDLPS